MDLYAAVERWMNQIPIWVSPEVDDLEEGDDVQMFESGQLDDDEQSLG